MNEQRRKKNIKHFPFLAFFAALVFGYIGGTMVLTNAESWVNGTNYIHPNSSWSNNVNITGAFNAIDANFTGIVTIQNTLVCLQNGANCPINATVISSQSAGWRNDSGGGNVSLVNPLVNVSAGTLFVNNANGRVGINTFTPSTTFTVNGNTNLSGGNTTIFGLTGSATDVTTGILLFSNGFDSSGLSNANKIIFYQNGASDRYGIGLSSNSINFFAGSSGMFRWYTGHTGPAEGTGIMNLSNTGQLSIPTIASRGITNNGTFVTTGASFTLNASGNITGSTVYSGLPTSNDMLFNRAYLESRAQNLVSNGNGYVLSDYNFESLNYIQRETYSGKGSFETYVLSGSSLSREFMPVDPSKTYRLSGWAKAGNTDGTNYSATNRQYFGISANDIDGNNIAPYNYQIYTGSARARLIRPITDGDTSIWVSNVTGWNNATITANHSRNILWYGYSNSFNYTYPDYTYSRNTSVILDCLKGANSSGTHGLWPVGGINYTSGEIQLNGVWDSSTCGNVSNNTAVINTLSGGTYKYIAAVNVIVPNNWTKYTGYIGGIDENLTANTNMFPPGTATAQVLHLVNYPGTTAGNVIRWSMIEFTEMTSSNLEVASATQAGTVALANQQLGTGDKYFASRVGVGTTTPSAALHVTTSNITIPGIAYTAPVGATGNHLVLENSAGTDLVSVNTNGQLYVNGTIGVNVAPSLYYPIYMNKVLTLDGSAGIFSNVQTVSPGISPIGLLFYSSAAHTAGTTSYNYGVFGYAFAGNTANASTTTGSNYGGYFIARKSGHGLVSNNYGALLNTNLDANYNGTVTTNGAVYVANSHGANTTTTTSVLVDTSWTHGQSATITNAYGIRLNEISANSSAFSIWSNGPKNGTSIQRYNLYLLGDAPNYIEAKLGLGTTTPSDKLTVAGNATIMGNLTVQGTTNTTQLYTNNVTITGNITMRSNNGSLWNCGVSDLGVFSCA